jgi:hypothetical protein
MFAPCIPQSVHERDRPQPIMMLAEVENNFPALISKSSVRGGGPQGGGPPRWGVW